MADKTKATLQGRPSNTNKSTIDITRPCAGGQSTNCGSGSVNLHTISGLVEPTILKLLGLGCAQNFGHPIEGYAGFWRHPDNGYRGYTPTAFCKFIAQPFDSSLACLRSRRLISPLIEATTKPAVLSPSSFTFSSSSINSSGTRETICRDLLFLEPVAMSAFPLDRWHSVYSKEKYNQYLKVAFTLFYGWCMPLIIGEQKMQRPGVLGTTTEASNQTVNRGNSYG